jgi:hypothetical protein
MIQSLKFVYYKLQKLFRKLSTIGVERLSEKIDSILLTFNILPSINLPDKALIFVGQTLNHRVIRHAKIISQNTNYDIIFLIGKNSPLLGLTSELANVRIIRFRNIIHLKRFGISLKSKNASVYAFASKPSYPAAFIKESKLPFVYDPYDCFSIYYGKKPAAKWLTPEVAGEEFCIKYANGLIARNPELREASRLFGIKNPNNILFPDYCDETRFIDSKLKKEEISFVYSGGIYGKHELKTSHGLTDFFDTIEKLDLQKIDFHIYPSPLLRKESYYDYIDAQQQYAHFHFHKSISQEKLSEELSQYHFGILPHFRSEKSNLSDEKMRTASSLKLFNYLEAGLPVIVSAELEFMAWLVKRYKIGFAIQKEDVVNLKKLVQAHDYCELQKNVLESRQKLSYHNTSKRFIQFLETKLFNSPSHHNNL